MRRYLFSLFVKLCIGLWFIYWSYCAINYSNFYYLFFGNLLLLSGLGLLTESLALLMLRIFSNSKSRKVAIISISRSTFIILFITDLIIRLTSVMDTYNERTGGNYFSLSNQENLNSWYWVHPPNTINTNKKLEFRFYRKVN